MEVREAESLALENAEPLLDLVHPGAMDGREEEAKARMSREPRLYLLPFVNAHVVEHDVNRLDRRGDDPDTFHLPRRCRSRADNSLQLYAFSLRQLDRRRRTSTSHPSRISAQTKRDRAKSMVPKWA